MSPWMLFVMRILFGVCGAVGLCASLFNWDWFFDTASAAVTGGRNHRTIARWFYGICSALMLVALTAL